MCLVNKLEVHQHPAICRFIHTPEAKDEADTEIMFAKIVIIGETSYLCPCLSEVWLVCNRNTETRRTADGKAPATALSAGTIRQEE